MCHCTTHTYLYQLPGAWTVIDGEKVTLFGSKFIDNRLEVKGREVLVEGVSSPAVVTSEGLVLFGSDGKKVLVSQMQFENGKTIRASKYGLEEDTVVIELTAEEQELSDKIKVFWSPVFGVCDCHCGSICSCRKSGLAS